MSLRELCGEVLANANASEVDFDVLNEELRAQALETLCVAAAFAAANQDAIDNIKSLNLTRDPEDLIEYLKNFADRQFVDEDADEAGMARSFYHGLQMLLAGLEVYTGLPMTEPAAFARAYDHYWDTTKAILLQVQFHRKDRSDDMSDDDGDF